MTPVGLLRFPCAPPPARRGQRHPRPFSIHREPDGGLTLLEVLIATAILAVIITAIYLVFFASAGMGEKETALRDAQFQLHLRMDQIVRELRESSQPLVRTASFTDSQMPTPSQSILVIVSARDDGEQFQSVNARPQWQKLIVYAAYFDPVLQTPQLRRYVVSPAPDEFKAEDTSPAISVTAAEIHLGPVTIQRSEGERLISRFDYLKATPNGNSVSLDLSIQGGTALGRAVDLSSETKGRN